MNAENSPSISIPGEAFISDIFVQGVFARYRILVCGFYILSVVCVCV